MTRIGIATTKTLTTEKIDHRFFLESTSEAQTEGLTINQMNYMATVL